MEWKQYPKRSKLKRRQATLFWPGHSEINTQGWSLQSHASVYPSHHHHCPSSPNVQSRDSHARYLVAAPERIPFVTPAVLHPRRRHSTTTSIVVVFVIRSEERRVGK